MKKSAVKEARIFERSQAYRDNFDKIKWEVDDAREESEDVKERHLPIICARCGRPCCS